MGELLIKETSLQRIMRKTGRKPIQCKCNLCKQQCHTPCLGTPEDIEKLIDAGYADRLALTQWAAGIYLGVTTDIIPMIQPVAGNEFCAFFENGLCVLHDEGLKPTEGRLSHHSIRLDNFKPSKSIGWNVAKEWILEENSEIIARVIIKYVKAAKLE
ncbi:hypothetical protein [Bacteroides sp.]|uniref:hypothetical protein n=1 Tax=Bacteroides sp. TaxID=29523 RepID=UPI002632F569|nr:hypothetical protein [Bacteroides sp.]